MLDPLKLRMLKSRQKSAAEFNFDNLYPSKPLFGYLPPSEIDELSNIATSFRLGTKIKIKQQKMNQIMSSWGFKRFAGGTNRIVYSYYEDPTILTKVAIDRVGMDDNPNEYGRQVLLKPWCSKMFSTSQHGTVGLCERVIPVTNIEEFKLIGPDVYDIIVNKFIGRLVIDDMGSERFLNWGIRNGFGPVLLDYPYVYEVDGNKLFCNRDIDGIICGGEIDYDAGFNHLYCTKCGKRYKALDLKMDIEQNKVILGTTRGGKLKMKVTVKRGNDVVATFGDSGSPVMKPHSERRKFDETKPMTVILCKNGKPIQEEKPETKEEITKPIMDTDIPEGFSVEPEEEKEETTILPVEMSYNEEEETPIEKKDDDIKTAPSVYKPYKAVTLKSSSTFGGGSNPASAWKNRT